MFSMIFFIFVAVVAIAGFVAVTWRKKNRVPLENDESAERYNRETTRSKSAFNEPSTGDIKGGIIPTDNKLSQKDFDEDSDSIL